MIRTLPIALLAFVLGLVLGLRLADGPAPDGANDTPHLPEAPTQPLTSVPEPRQVSMPASPASPAGHSLDAELRAIRHLLAEDRLTEAGQRIDTLLETQPWQPDALLLRIDWLARSGRHRAALELLLERRSLERDAHRAELIESHLEPLFDRAIAAAVTQGDAAARLTLLELAAQQLNHQPRYQWQLAQAQFDLHHYADCRLTLQPLLYDAAWGEQAQALERRAQRRLNLAGHYRHRLHLSRHADHRLLRLEVNGVPVNLLIDTGAGITLLNPDAAARSGLVENGQRRQLSTVGGQVEAPLAEARLTLPGFGPIVLPVAIHASGLPTGIDGLLGMDLLRQFAFHIDQERDLLLLDEGAP